MGYIAMTAFVLNLVVAVVLSAVLQDDEVLQRRRRDDAGDYFADAGDPRVEKDKAAREVDEADPHPSLGRRVEARGRVSYGTIIA